MCARNEGDVLCILPLLLTEIVSPWMCDIPYCPVISKGTFCQSEVFINPRCACAARVTVLGL
jgi:hypothetical protein